MIDDKKKESVAFEQEMIAALNQASGLEVKVANALGDARTRLMSMDLERERALLDKMKNDALLRKKFFSQIFRFRRTFFFVLLIFMILETLALFSIVLLSSTSGTGASKRQDQYLRVDGPTLQVLVGATISVIVVWIIRSVFKNGVFRDAPQVF